MFLLNDEELIERVLDRGTWKHSWHVKRTPSGHIDFYDKDNLEKMLNTVEHEIDYAIECLERAKKAQKILVSKISELEKE